MRRVLAVLLGVLVAAGTVQAQRGNIWSTRAEQEFAQALTSGTKFGVPRYATAALPTCNASNKGAVAFDTSTSGFKGCDGTSWGSLGGLSSPVSGDYVVTGKWTFGSAADAANSVRLGETAGCVVIEGSAADANEATICAPTVGADIQYNFPDASAGTYYVPIFSQIITFAGPTAARTVTLPDEAFTVVGLATTQTLTNKTLAAANNVIDADTAVALAANGANCSAGNYPLGVDASGAVETCTADDDVPDAGEVSDSALAASAVDGGTGGEIEDGTITGADMSTNQKTVSVTFVIDGGGSAISTGVKGDLVVEFAGTITQVTMAADQSGSIVVDVWKDTYANYPPTVADSITASAKPTITTATKSQDSTLTGWTTSISAGDTLRFNVDSASTIQRVVISLKITKT